MKEAEKQNVRAQFDDVLKKHISRLIDSMPGAASLPFDLTTITSLILFIEREDEIKAFQDSPPDRYTETTLIEDLTDTGLEVDDHARAAIKDLSQMGFISIESDGHLTPRQSTPELVGVLDNMFPGMPGLNFVAYIIQTMDEALSGRKDIGQAVSQFDQTLQAKGVPLSIQNAAPAAKPEITTEKKSTDPKGEDRKQAYLKRLSKIRSKPHRDSIKTADPKNISPSGATEPPKVVSLFPKTPPPEEQTAAEESIEENNGQIEETPSFDSAAPDIEKQDGQDDVDAMTADEAPSEETLKDADVVSLPTESLQDEPETAPPGAGQEEDIDEKVREFQERLAMSCPVCKDGVINASTTGKGKHYYVCQKEDCGFISWGKPYHFPCPLCQNPFLIEFNTPRHAQGLKCPKATCNYRQDNLDSPLNQTTAPPPPEDDKTQPAAEAEPQLSDPSTPPQKKRKRVVRKRLVRKKW